MELRHLRYFLALADNPRMDRAAKHCGLSASVLSRHISDLEDSLGCSLFRRKGNTVSLSAAGQVFYQRAKDLLTSAAAAAGEVRATAAAMASQVRIGHSGLWWMKRYAGAIARFRHECPGIHLHPIEATPAELPGALRRGEIDMALMEHVDLELRIEFKVRRIEALAAQIALPEGHRLAHRKRLRLRELAEEVWIGWNERLYPGRRHLLLDAAESARFCPCIAQDAESDFALYDLVAGGGSVGYLAHEPAAEMPRGVTLVPLSPAVIEFPVFLVWRKDADNQTQLEALAAQLLAPAASHPEH
jgi:DNA-binding transcriptional LysR family regulator